VYLELPKRIGNNIIPQKEIIDKKCFTKGYMDSSSTVGKISYLIGKNTDETQHSKADPVAAERIGKLSREQVLRTEISIGH
jgi:hypothetical protein